MLRQVICTVLLLSATGSVLAQGLKIGVINSEVVVQNFSEFRRAESQLGREVEGWQAERSAWEADMERLKAAILERENQLVAGQNIFTESRKATLQTQIDSLKFDFSERLNRQTMLEQERFNSRRTELLSGIFEDVNTTIEEIGERDGFDLIIDSANGTVVYARDPQDLTDALLQQLDNR